MAKAARARVPQDPLPSLVLMEALDGFPLGARVYDPDPDVGDARATLLINPATAVPATYYARFAAHAARTGYRVLTYDYRGIGASRRATLRGFDATMTDWARLDTTAALAQARSFGDPVVLVGHSFGAQSLGLADDLGTVEAALMVGGQLGYWGHWPLSVRARYAALWYALVPSATEVFGYLPGKFGIGEDLPRGVALQWARWCRHPGYFLADHPEATERLRAFDRPALLYSFTDDPFAPLEAVNAFVASFTPQRVLHRHMHPRQAGVKRMGHFGFFRPSQGGQLWDEALGFFDDALQGRPPTVARLASPEPFGIGLDEIMLDLSFGRDR